MEDPISHVEMLFEKAAYYTRTSAELFKLKALDKASETISAVFVRIVIALFIAFAFFVLNIGIALWIGEELGKLYYGFFVIAGFYTLVGILLYVFRNKWLKLSVKNSIITHALN
jgi:phosphoglycerol transferase MdoB-like AlkP superfamily enzyme